MWGIKRDCESGTPLETSGVNLMRSSTGRTFSCFFFVHLIHIVSICIRTTTLSSCFMVTASAFSLFHPLSLLKVFAGPFVHDMVQHRDVIYRAEYYCPGIFRVAEPNMCRENVAICGAYNPIRLFAACFKCCKF